MSAIARLLCSTSGRRTRLPAPWRSCVRQPTPQLDRRLSHLATQRIRVLLPATVLPHRSDTSDVIGAALRHKAWGAGYRTIADRLGVPSETVRGWLRRAAHQAEG